MLRPWEFVDPPCREVGVEAFYPDAYGNMGYHPLAIRTLKALCADCPFKIDCFEWAVRHEAHGIWGGSTERERRIYRQNHKIPFESLEDHRFA